jgi:hypothetical protein
VTVDAGTVAPPLGFAVRGRRGRCEDGTQTGVKRLTSFARTQWAGALLDIFTNRTALGLRPAASAFRLVLVWPSLPTTQHRLVSKADGWRSRRGCRLVTERKFKEPFNFIASPTA